jgi:hypothetical protein
MMSNQEKFKRMQEVTRARKAKKAGESRGFELLRSR